LVEVLRELPDEVTTALPVGHNPGCENLVHDLGRDSDPAAATALALKYPTSGIAVLELDADWASLGRRTARLVEFAVPRG
jgi:phosphohistidine phosphatase